MITYLIDGNNLMHKVHELKRIFYKDKLAVRDRLVLTIETYYSANRKNIKYIVCFDGHPADGVKYNNIKVKFSYNRQADDIIREEIERAKNTRNLKIVTEDLALVSFAKKNECQVIKPVEFYRLITQNRNNDITDKGNITPDMYKIDFYQDNNEED